LCSVLPPPAIFLPFLFLFLRCECHPATTPLPPPPLTAQEYASLDSSLHIVESIDRNLVVQKDLVVNYADITHLRDIGAGATGKVALSKWKGQPVAVKKFYGVPGASLEEFVRSAPPTTTTGSDTVGSPASHSKK
jgi:hypothetical protein